MFSEAYHHDKFLGVELLGQKIKIYFCLDITKCPFKRLYWFLFLLAMYDSDYFPSA